MEASANFHGSTSNSTNFDGISTDVYTLPPTSNNASMEVMFASIERTFTFMEVNFGSACTSMELDRTEVI